VQSLERATALLRGATSIDGLSAILLELGFLAPALPLDDKSRVALGLPTEIHAASIADGTGCLRGLAIELDGAADVRQALTAVAAGLSRNAAQFLWLVVSRRVGASELAIVCWSSTRSHPHVVSLVCNRDRLIESDAETLCTLSAAGPDSDLLTHARWLDVLGRDGITQRFFRTMQAVVSGLADSLTGFVTPDERRELALLYTSRLIFLSFLQTKGWLDGDFAFLRNGFDDCISRGHSYQKTVLEPLFFGTLNTAITSRSSRARRFGKIPFLNGGLFCRSALEKRKRACEFTDEAFGNAYGSLFSRYRFSPREDSTAWSEASIDPEILGKAFEALMAAPDRKTSGAFFTPQILVEEVAGHALSSVLENDGSPREMLSRIRVLDSACGSGAFLVYMLERIATLRQEHGEAGSLADVRRQVLTASIFGVDLNQMAVWLCELRLWLSIVIENGDVDPMRIAPLPNLDRHIRVGDSLAGGAFGDRSFIGSRKIVSLRARYTRSAGQRKRTLARSLDRMERSAAIDVLMGRRLRLTSERKEILIALRARDLFGDRHAPSSDTRTHLADIRSSLSEIATRVKALRAGAALPFSFAAHFSDVAAAGGFDVVVGNPPWVRVHRIAETSRERLRRDFMVYRNAAWKSGAAIAGAGKGFAAQIDMAALFVERSCDLLRPGGTMALLLPAKLWRSLAGGGVRQLLFDRAAVVVLEDLTESEPQFDAAVYPSLLVARRLADDPDDRMPPISAAVRTRRGSAQWICTRESLSVDATPGSPWVLIPPAARRAFDRVSRRAVPVFRSRFGRPLLGVKTGCNNAFIVRVETLDGTVAHVCAGSRVGIIEREMLRPLIRGETLEKWRLVGQREYLVWPHDQHGRPLHTLPQHTRRWLFPFHETLSTRSDLHGRFPWWSVFRTESANHESPRVVWADFGLSPRALVVEAREPLVALNSCYVVSCPTRSDACALATILNSPLCAAWLNSIAEPARGGYRRYLGWTVSLLPIPADWDRACDLLAPLGERAMRDEIPTDAEILRAVLDAYQLNPTDVQPLLFWTDRCD
jgi:hypothetical protein